MISPAMRTTIIQAVILGVVAAVLVWFLEDFNRRKLVDDWTRFVEGWAGGPATGPMGHNGNAS